MRQIPDGMLRERSDGAGPAVLTAPLDIGVGTKWDIGGAVSAPDLLVADRFPRSSRYSPEWILAAASGGANPLWLTEWLSQALPLRAGRRVPDLGAGRAASSVFLRREFGVQVRATDLWTSATENLRRIEDAGTCAGSGPRTGGACIPRSGGSGTGSARAS